jgi:hypothetical protein
MHTMQEMYLSHSIKLFYILQMITVSNEFVPYKLMTWGLIVKVLVSYMKNDLYES